MTQILLAATVFGYFANTCSAILQGIGRPGLASCGQLLGAFVTVVLIVCLSSTTEMSGAIAASIAVIAQAASMMFCVCALLNIRRAERAE
ncbi:polysaccharide biosynthesis C-terminal domain-containing protein [Gordonia sp. GW1C4-4]|uniref:Polysaccharide biosynthesis C-terminal domain-containing protein n=1 Tax=Gordonia tangerina TaxID=2911060 RepID=A0ABS9DNL4_9ACTN|nr:polysaccharide biosynthesis C-terminal domain-containing protein [Gordonia tangerina]